MSGPERVGSTVLPHEAHVAALACLEGVGPARLRWLLGLGPPQEVWERVSAGRLPRRSAASPPIDDQLRSSWVEHARRIDPAALWRRCVEGGIGVVTLGAAGYPVALADDPEPPVVLFHRGDPDVLVGPRVAIVGTRRATGYGRRHAANFAEQLSAAGVSVVSGLALGIDAAAHAGAVRADAAPPVGIVGAGLDAPCPRRNLELAEQVARRGVLLSEVPPGVGAAPWRFPVRNRVIAALADAVVVIESPGAGGSMHTVREALARDRAVLAMPGPIDSPASEGTIGLIADGAGVCARVEDILAAIGHVAPSGAAVSDRRSVEERPEPHGAAAAVLERVGWRPLSVEQLARECGLGFVEVAAALAQLESAGWVERHDGWVERVARGRGRVRGDGGHRA